MLICPKCKCEYQEGCTICKDCECKLIEIPEAGEKNVLVKKDSRISGLTGRLLIFSVVFVIGLIILMRSINLGDNEMTNIMKAHGGSWRQHGYQYVHDLFGTIYNKIQIDGLHIINIWRLRHINQHKY